MSLGRDTAEGSGRTDDDAAALRELAREALSDPNVRSVLSDAVRSEALGTGALPSPVLQASVRTVLRDTVRELFESPGLRAMVESAVREQLDSTRGISGLAALKGNTAPVLRAAVRSGLEGVVKEALDSPTNRTRVEKSIREQLTGLGYGMTAPAVRDAVATQLQDLVKDALNAPGTRMAVEKVVNQQLSGFGLGFTAPAVRDAVSRQVDGIVKDAMLQPGARSTLERAVDRQLHGMVPGFVSPAIGQAVANVLDDAVRSAVLTPDTQESITRAIRLQTARLDEAAHDPALAVMLRNQGASAVAQSESEPEIDPPPETLVTEGEYSKQFKGPDSFFSAHEVVIDSFESLTTEIAALASKNPGMRFVWRGHQDAAWGLHSSLYRLLMTERGIKLPGQAGASERQTFPDEDAMVRAEDSILAEAAEWRMSDWPALELFARLQHQGGPSRLLDVTRSPFIAAWFAVESHPNTNDRDARLFALATSAPSGGSDSSSEPVLKEAMTGGRYPFWFFQNANDRREADWGTGALRRVWVPPVYDPRIASQNAAFLLEGVPMFTQETLRLFKYSDRERWGITDIAASMSIYARPVDPRTRVRPVKSKLAPLFTFRIKASSKSAIRSLLESAYGMTTATVYPDVQGLSKRLCFDSGWLGEPLS